ncbi:MAG TPA: glycoside hydrolase family 28 protein [Candidatus Sulfotelmatobacter sp.]|nr:glycoside hydrolase family 28 protein [Candidatus Sulfotelmatobacter sp.]
MFEGDKSRRDFLGAGAALFAVAGGPGVGQNAGAEKTSFVDVTRFGASGDGKALDSPAINKAIEAAAASGGGTVCFPAGTYLCYSIRLKSNVALWLGAGATIVAADSPEDGSGKGYDAAESNAPWENYQDYGHNHWHDSLLWGEGLENVAILGPGRIWGKGLSRGWGAGPKAESPGVGNKAIALKGCRNVVLRDFGILHGGHFGVLATGVDNLTIDNLTIDTNRDGMDVDCCRNVHIANCTVNSPWDDGICLKSSYALGYARATEMVTITNCVVMGGFEEGSVLDGTYRPFGAEAGKVPRTGRIKFGTESNGGFKNVAVSNCVFEACQGFALESVDGALLEDVSITNITMRDLVGPPIFLRLGARMRGPAGVEVGKIRRVTISNVVCSNAASEISSIVSGIPGHEIEDVRISDVLIEHRGGGTKEMASRHLAEEEKEYPEPKMFGETPSHGFFVRHVKGIALDGVKIECQKKDERPAFVLEDVQDAEFVGVRAPVSAGQPTFVLRDVKDFRLHRCQPLRDVEIGEVKERDL